MRWDTLFGHSEEFSTHLVAYPMYNFTIPVGQELEHSLAEFSLLICEGLVLSIIRINGTNRGYQKELHEWFLLFSNWMVKFPRSETLDCIHFGCTTGPRTELSTQLHVKVSWLDALRDG